MFYLLGNLIVGYGLVCVGPGRKPERWFSHDAALSDLSQVPSQADVDVTQSNHE